MITKAFEAGHAAGIKAMANHTSSAWPSEPQSPWKTLKRREAFAQGFKHAVQSIRAERDSRRTCA